jgi:hypothetical protein
LIYFDFLCRLFHTIFIKEYKINENTLASSLAVTPTSSNRLYDAAAANEKNKISKQSMPIVDSLSTGLHIRIDNNNSSSKASDSSGISPRTLGQLKLAKSGLGTSPSKHPGVTSLRPVYSEKLLAVQQPLSISSATASTTVGDEVATVNTATTQMTNSSNSTSSSPDSIIDDRINSSSTATAVAAAKKSFARKSRKQFTNKINSNSPNILTRMENSVNVGSECETDNENNTVSSKPLKNKSK